MPRVGVRRPNIVGWAFVLLLALLAEIAVRGFELHDSVATPSGTLRALWEGMSSGTLSGELGTTLRSYAEGFALAIVIGVVLGVVIGSSRTLLAATSVVIEFLRPIPAVALIPVAILLFGLGIPMRRFIIAYAAVWPILINTLYGVRGSDRLLHDVARTSGVTGFGKLLRVTLLAAAPSIATGVRVSASIALLVGVTAEFLSGNTGVGAYMKERQAEFQIPELYAAILLTALLGYVINLALRGAERHVLFWAGEDRAR